MMRVLVPLLILALGSAQAQLPSETLSVSGILRDNGGTPLIGAANLTFRIYDLAVGGGHLWEELHPATALDGNGRYQVKLGATVPLGPGLFGTLDRWLAVEVNADGEMSPRLALSTIPYAHNSNLLEGSPAAVFAPRAQLIDQNPGTTPVHWDDLTGVPPGFADGVDHVDDLDPDPTNERNTLLVLNGTDLELTDSGGTLTAPLASLVDDADPDPANELNSTLVLNGTDLELTDSGGTLTAALASLVDDADPDPTNELSTTLVLNGTDLELTDAGGTLIADLSSLAGGGAGGGGGSLACPDPLVSVIPVTMQTLSTTPYTVPAGKTLYITSVLSTSSGNLLSIAGVGAVRGLTNQGSSSGSQTIGMPLLAGDGEVVSANSNSVTVNGYLVDTGVTPFHRRTLSTTPYIVPSGQVLVITNMLSESSGNQLLVQGRNCVQGLTNQGQSTGSQVLDHPVLAGGGQTVSANSNNVYIHGYLFGGSLGGSSGASSSSSLGFPDGLTGLTAVTINNLATTPYSPPAGQNLYITNYLSTSGSFALRINGLQVFDGYSNFGSANYSQRLDQPILVGPTDVLTTNTDGPVVNGFLVTASVTPMTVGNLTTTTFTVPSSQLLVVTGYLATSGSFALRVDGKQVFDGYSSFGSASYAQHLGLPLLVGETQVVSTNTDGPVLNGYLRAP